MQDEHSQSETAPKPADPNATRSNPTSPNRHITKSPHTTGPSRDMIGGPWLGLIVFIIIAIGLGWGLISLLQQQLSSNAHSSSTEQFDHGFNPDAIYTLKRDLVLGYLADGRIVLLPGRNDLPKSAPGRRSAVSVQEFRDNPQDHTEHIGVAEAGTRVQFVEVIDDRNNPQTRILVLTRLLTGPYAHTTPVVGMHLESADAESEQRRYVPRPELFEIVEPEAGPVQSEVPAPTQSNEQP